MSEEKKLYRSNTDRIILGVCAGLAKYFNFDPTLVRIFFVLFTFADGVGILIYIVLAIVVPKEPGPEVEINQEEKFKEFTKDIGKKTQNLAYEFKTNKNWFRNGRNIVGLCIIGLGIYLLLERIFPLGHYLGIFLWPAILILLGIVLLFKK